MKTLTALTFAAVVAATAPNLKANSVVLLDNSYEYGGGGEITAVTVPSFLGNYAPSAIVNGGFQTFCVEVTVNASFNTPYSFTLSQTTSLGDTLSVGAAYLYYLFATGNLPGYNYADTPSSPDGTRLQDAELLQTALWALLNQPNYFGQNLAADPYLNLAASTFANPLAPSGGAFDVDVMQLWDPNSPGTPSPYGYQNQLVLVPDGGWTVSLLGLGFGVLAVVPMVRRRILAAA